VISQSLRRKGKSCAQICKNWKSSSLNHFRCCKNAIQRTQVNLGGFRSPFCRNREQREDVFGEKILAGSTNFTGAEIVLLCPVTSMKWTVFTACLACDLRLYGHRIHSTLHRCIYRVSECLRSSYMIALMLYYHFPFAKLVKKVKVYIKWIHHVR
jgi:hypothetical protein